MEILIISFTAFFVAILTFFSGFGLGTILTPVFMLYFPTELAIALTGIVHFVNNIFKLVLVGKNANREVLLKFGIPAVLAALVGAWLLIHLPNSSPILSYYFLGKQRDIYVMKLLISILLFLFALIELIPWFNKLQFDKNNLVWGGLLSGFFGGLSGNQGALRSAFLIKAGLTKEAFIATAVVVSCFVDFTRLSMYATKISATAIEPYVKLVIFATLAAISGAFLGNKLLKKVTLKFLQITVALFLMLLSVALGFGFL